MKIQMAKSPGKFGGEFEIVFSMIKRLESKASALDAVIKLESKVEVLDSELQEIRFLEKIGFLILDALVLN